MEEDAKRQNVKTSGLDLARQFVFGIIIQFPALLPLFFKSRVYWPWPGVGQGQ
ncbi:MAG: hypothetical protein LBR11_00725 [Deltaproteobacteria bacterium]|jgi:hypothetical protein|nr:hypothetical protein [Deltaproteobacteria bacterium]